MTVFHRLKTLALHTQSNFYILQTFRTLLEKFSVSAAYKIIMGRFDHCQMEINCKVVYSNIEL